MAKPARFGLRIPIAGPMSGPDAIKRGATEAERLGFDTIWAHDYIVWNKELDSMHISCGSRETFLEAVEKPGYEPLFYESLSSLAFAAAVTDRIKLGTAVLCLPYRNPLVTAKQIATIDALSGGRVELGIGQGAPKSTRNVEFEVMGISRKTKVKQTREVFEAMREVWTKPQASWHGDFYSFEGAEVYPKPVTKPYPPVWIGGSAEPSLEMIADYADGWLSFWITPEQFPAAIADMHSRLEQRGRDPEQFTVGTEIHVYMADTTEDARKQVKRTMLAFEEGYEGTTGIFSDEGKEADALDEMWKSSLVGSSEHVTERLAEYIESGCTTFEMKFIYHNLDHMVAQWVQFAEEVAPSFA